MNSSSNNDSDLDKGFERLVQEAKAGKMSSWDQGDVLFNCVCLIVTVLLAVFFAPFSLLLLIFVLDPLGGVASAFGESVAHRQAGASILLGCLLGFTYLVTVASQW